MAKPKNPSLAEQRRFVERATAATEKTAGRTPSRVLKTFYPADVKIAGIPLSRCGLGILGLLERIEHPYHAALIGQPAVAPTIADQQRALFIFAKPREARDLLAAGEDALDRAVFEFCEQLEPAALAEIATVLPQLIREAMATMPGYDASGGEASTEGEAAGDPLPASGQPQAG